MKKSIIKKVLFLGLLVLSITYYAQNSKKNEAEKALKKIKELAAADQIVSKNLETFQTLDFVVFSNKEWSRLHESHSKDIVVHFPDGHIEKGIDQHINTLKAMFVYAPDTKIKEQPFRLGKDSITAVMGFMEGTFTKPMPMPDGTFIQPTGKTFKLPMATIAVWNKKGTMSEEYLFWDNQAFMNQIMDRKSK
ncbi:ester cyclase [Chryseobacterium sp. JK1]|uniref:ester cyclase n=1 Tax=Chryseobacterium sp. JK1 TaxID=874294 RepID=UPI003D685110